MVQVIEKPIELEAQQHYSPLPESAESIEKWLYENGAAKVVIEQNGHLSFYQDERVRGRQLIFKDWWVVRMSDGSLLSMSDLEFKHRFVRYTAVA